MAHAKVGIGAAYDLYFSRKAKRLRVIVHAQYHPYLLKRFLRVLHAGLQQTAATGQKGAAFVAVETPTSASRQDQAEHLRGCAVYAGQSRAL